MENRVPKVIRPHGHPAICRPGQSLQYCICLSAFERMLKIARHWDKDTRSTVLCQCEGGCHSRREDYFAAGMAKLPAEGLQFVLVTLQFTPANLSSLEIAMRSAGHDWETVGMGFTWQRRGKDANSPAIVQFKQLHKLSEPHAFDLPASVMYHLRISTDFFRESVNSPPAIPDAEIVKEMFAAKDRAAEREKKPRVPLGKRG